MKINSIKFTIVIFELIILSGVIVGLFLLEIPNGNQDVAYVVLGTLVADIAHSTNTLFQKREVAQ